MKRLLTLLLLAAGTAYGQIDNPPSSVNIVDATATGRAVLTATNPAAAATAISLGTTDAVTFGTLAAEQLSVLIGTNLYVNLAEDVSEFLVPVQLEDTLGVVGAATFSTNVTVTGNAILNGEANLAPAQTADSSDSLMTRGLTDVRYGFARWYAANDILSGAAAAGINPLNTGETVGNPTGAVLVTVSNINTKFVLPIDYRIGGEVKVVSYWTDRTLTNGGTNGDIAVWTMPFVVQPTTDTTNSGRVNGTQIQSTFTANYGGSERRFYVMEQTLNFGTITNINATNPSQLKFVELQRRGGDATDTSDDSIFLSGVHIYAEP